MPKFRKPVGCLFVLISLMLLLLILVQVFAPVIGTSVANKQLPAQLGTDASLGAVKLNLLGGSAGVKELVIMQPEGFEGDPFLELESLHAHVPISSAASRDPLVVKKVHLDGLTMRMITDTNAVANVTKIGPQPAEEDDETEAGEEPEPAAEEVAEPAAPPPPIWIQHVLLENMAFLIQDLGKELEFDFDQAELELTDIRIEAGETSYDPGEIRADFRFKGPRSPGSIVINGRLETIDPTATGKSPAMQFAVGIFGFDLTSVDPLLKPSPTAARAAIGGGGFDMEIFMQITPGDELAVQELQGRYLLLTDRGGKLSGPLGGSLAEPDFPPAKILGNLMGHQFARLGRMGVNIAQGGLETGKTVLKTGGAAVKGVGKSALKLGGGVLKTVKGVATLDMEEAGSGLKDATVGTVNEVGKTVGDIAGTAAKGLGDTAGTITGGDDLQVWWESVEVRKAEFEKRSEEWLSQNPFPPKPVLNLQPSEKPEEEEASAEEETPAVEEGTPAVEEQDQDDEEEDSEGFVQGADAVEDEDEDSLRGSGGD